ncbi:MAG: SynChlorMet cassette protein ScmC [Methanotrichaceae archaeon]|nr:SynChlorMet cassette protein ScmC [Methanotrichaceae archaeon]
MNYQQETLGITLGNGIKVGMRPGDATTSQIISRLNRIMRFRPLHDANIQVILTSERNTDSVTPDAFCRYHLCNNSYWTFISHEDDGMIVCELSDKLIKSENPLDLMHISYLIAMLAQYHGGLLLHGALAQKEGWGVILAGEGGIGKTTASNRLQSPWISLSDDATLVAGDTRGKYWAHPWPTWSRFFNGEIGGTWNVNCSVQLKGIFFLNQGNENRVMHLSRIKAIGRINECSKQILKPLTSHLETEGRRTFYSQLFNNICLLSHEVPSYILRSSLSSHFWLEIEKTILGVENDKILL